MARCDWCGKVGREMRETPNGKTDLRLCPMCMAEHELRQGGPLLPPTPAPESWWQRFKRKFS